MASQKSMRRAVMSLLFCSFSSSLLASYHLSLMFFLSFLCRPASVSSDLSSLIGWLQVRLQQFPDLGHFLHRLSHSECCFGHFILGCLYFQMCFLQKSLGFVDRPAAGPVLCVPPPSDWNEASFRRSPISFGSTCWFQ